MTYLDNAATTFTDVNAINIIYESLKNDYINPSALYGNGRDKFNEIIKCKQNIAQNLSSIYDYNNIYFTSGGCEGNNWVIKGCVAEYYRYYQNEGLIHNINANVKIPHIITTAFEHHSILNACQQLEDLGLAKITYLQPNSKTGIIDANDILKHISHINDDFQTILVSVMWVNNVLGTIQPIKEIGEICKQHLIKFHTDAVQAIGNIHIDMTEYNIDFMTVSGHKFHAPKGIGFVYIKDSQYIIPMISGGGQEFGMRAGTENLPYIKAIDYCLNKYNNIDNINTKYNHVEKLKQVLLNEFENRNDCIVFKSSDNIGTVNIAFKDLISDMLVYNLGERGFMVSVGSACDNGNFEDSHVLTAVNYPKEFINGNIRITFNEYNTVEEIVEFIKVLKEEVAKMRGY